MPDEEFDLPQRAAKVNSLVTGRAIEIQRKRKGKEKRRRRGN